MKDTIEGAVAVLTHIDSAKIEDRIIKITGDMTLPYFDSLLTRSTGMLPDEVLTHGREMLKKDTGRTSSGFACTCPPINRLPVELFAEVFSYVSAIEKYDDWDIGDFLSLPDTQMRWVKLMFVCTYWRKVGLAMPHLWRKISITPRNVDSLEYRLARSQGCTIDVWFSCEPGPALPLIMKHAPRIRSISTTMSFLFWDLPSIKPLFEIPLPALQCINIAPRLDHWCSSSTAEQKVVEEYFDLGLGEAVAPGRLRKLTVERLVLPASPGFWEKLTYLKLGTQLNEEKALRADDILDILEMTPLLQRLTLMNYQGYRLQFARARNPIRLSYLRHVQLEGCFSLITQVLQYVLAPNLHEFHVGTGIPNDLNIVEGYTLLFPPGLRSILRGFRRIYISPSHIGDSAKGILPMGDGSRSKRLTLQVCTGEDYNVADSLTALCRIFSEAPIRTLCVRSGHTTMEAWKNVFKTFPTLHTLELVDFSYHPHGVLAALDAIASLQEPQKYARLAELHLECTNLRNTLWSYELLERVLDTAVARAASNLAFSKIALMLEHTYQYVRPNLNFRVHRWMLHEIRGQCSVAIGFGWYWHRNSSGAKLLGVSGDMGKSEEGAPGEVTAEHGK